MKVLVIVAHPDDESLFCGGAIAVHVEAGDVVSIVSLGTGVGAREDASHSLQTMSILRASAFRRACDILGAVDEDSEIYETFPDQQADTVPQLKINKAVEAIVEAREPDLIYTHFTGDYNVDHRRVAEAVNVATRMGPTVRHMPSEFPEKDLWPFEPNMKVRLWQRHIDKKIAACLCYSSELKADAAHPRSERALRVQPHAESFREIR